MLYGTSDAEPQTDYVVAQLSQELYNSNLLLLLIQVIEISNLVKFVLLGMRNTRWKRACSHFEFRIEHFNGNTITT